MNLCGVTTCYFCCHKFDKQKSWNWNWIFIAVAVATIYYFCFFSAELNFQWPHENRLLLHVLIWNELFVCADTWFTWLEELCALEFLSNFYLHFFYFSLSLWFFFVLVQIFFNQMRSISFACTVHVHREECACDFIYIF